MATNIPLIQTHGRVTRESTTASHSRQNSFTLNAGYQDYAAAVVSVLDTFGWESITLIYDSKSVIIDKSITFISHLRKAFAWNLTMSHQLVSIQSFLHRFSADRFHEAAFFSSLSTTRKYQMQFINVYSPQTTCEDQKSDDNIYRIVKQVQQFASQIQLLFVDVKIMAKILEKVLTLSGLAHK